MNLDKINPEASLDILQVAKIDQAKIDVIQKIQGELDEFPAPEDQYQLLKAIKEFAEIEQDKILKDSADAVIEQAKTWVD